MKQLPQAMKKLRHRGERTTTERSVCRVMYCGGCAAAAACGWLAAVCRIAEHRLSMYIHIQYATTNARNCVRKPNRVPFIKDTE